MAKTVNKSDKFWENFDEQVDLWRLNIHRFATEWFGLPLALFQQFVIYMMNFPTIGSLMFFACRGLGKSYLTMVFCLCKGVLYPGITIIVAAPTLQQANLLLNKVEELKKQSPNIAPEIESISLVKDKGEIKLRNGSKIKTCVSNNNSRGERCQVLILDESNKMDKDIVDNVLVPFLSNKRVPKFLRNSKYKKYIEAENNIQISLTSIGGKEEWSYKTFLEHIEYIKKGSKTYCSLSMPYQFGTEAGIVDRKLIERKVRENLNDLTQFSSEFEVIPYGGLESSMFKFDELNRSRKISVPMLPLTDEQYIEYEGDIKRSKFYRRKEKDEIRVISMDIAVAGGRANDNSVFTVISCIPQFGEQAPEDEELQYGYYTKEISYIEVMNGVDLDDQILRFKQIFYDLECDYAAIDAQAAIGVQGVMACGRRTYDKGRGVWYSGWKTYDRNEKFDAKVADPNAKEVLFCVQAAGSSNMNYNMLINAKLEFERNRVFTLMDEDLVIDELNKKFGYMKLSTSPNPLDKEKAQNIILPFINTGKLVEECITTQIVKLPSGKYTYDEGTGRKDRVMCMIYGLYLISLLEQDLRVINKKINISDYFSSNTDEAPKRNIVNPFSENLNKLRGFGQR